MAKDSRARTAVGEPLTPAVLARLGVLEKLPETPADFSPAGAWVNKYLVFTCHGYVETGNEGIGVLRLERSPDANRSGFTINVRQRIVNDAGHVHEIEVLARCRADRLATPVEWRLLSRFEDAAGHEVAELRAEERGSYQSGKVVVKKGVSKRTWEGRLAVTSDWLLMEAVQRLEAEAAETEPFDMLQGLSVMRSGQRLLPAGQGEPAESAGYRFRRIVQVGRGVLPYDYWLLAESSRLAIVTTGPRAYVLCEEADDIVNRRLESIRARMRGRRSE